MLAVGVDQWAHIMSRFIPPAHADAGIDRCVTTDLIPQAHAARSGQQVLSDYQRVARYLFSRGVLFNILFKV